MEHLVLMSAAGVEIGHEIESLVGFKRMIAMGLMFAPVLTKMCSMWWKSEMMMSNQYEFRTVRRDN
jgi:hypothetical protein